jgi:hypothetical protein
MATWTDARWRPYVVPAMLLLLAGLIFLAYVVAQTVNPWGQTHDTSTWQGVLAQLFNMDVENNVPTWYTAVLWLTCSYVAAKAAIASADSHPRLVGYWWLVAFIAALLSMDEVASVHELVGTLAGSWIIHAVAPGEVYNYSWLIAGVIFASVIFVLLLPFSWLLPRRVAGMLLIAGAIFMLGAVGMEAFTAAIHDEVVALKPGDRMWTIIIAAEESLEMLGVIVAIHAILLFTGLRSAEKC